MCVDACAAGGGWWGRGEGAGGVVPQKATCPEGISHQLFLDGPSRFRCSWAMLDVAADLRDRMQRTRRWRHEMQSTLVGGGGAKSNAITRVGCLRQTRIKMFLSSFFSLNV